MSKILWILGAGASKHLGMPLLNDFKQFFGELWYCFPENRKDPQFITCLPQAIRDLEDHADKNIEELLTASTSPLDDAQKKNLKLAIRRGFERRNLGRLLKWLGNSKKLESYSRLLSLMDPSDEVISFNYDNALELPLCVVSKDFAYLNVSELSVDQVNYLTEKKTGKGKTAIEQWIPSDCIASLNERSLEIIPTKAFADETNRVVGRGSLKIPFIKIHGSVNWFEKDGKIHIGNPPNRDTPPLLIYPEPSKQELSLPALKDVLLQAQTALSRCKAIVIVGYSFPASDAEGHPFVSHLASSGKDKKMLAVDPFPKKQLLKVVGENQIIEKPFEKAVQLDNTGHCPLGTEIEKLRNA